jgi:hypothetical protein
MIFLVSDSQTNRHKAILAFVSEDQSVIAVILAAIDLEWTIRRVIDGMLASRDQGFVPDKVSGLDAYAKVWSKALPPEDGQSLPDVVGEWQELKVAYQARNDIVHGRQGSTGLEFANSRVERILGASKSIAKYGSENGADPYHRLKKRVLTGPTKTKKPDNLKSQIQP